jgi:hypothetical protein
VCTSNLPALPFAHPAHNDLLKFGNLNCAGLSIRATALGLDFGRPQQSNDHENEISLKMQRLSKVVGEMLHAAS